MIIVFKDLFATSYDPTLTTPITAATKSTATTTTSATTGGTTILRQPTAILLCKCSKYCILLTSFLFHSRCPFLFLVASLKLLNPLVALMFPPPPLTKKKMFICVRCQYNGSSNNKPSKHLFSIPLCNMIEAKKNKRKNKKKRKTPCTSQSKFHKKPACRKPSICFRICSQKIEKDILRTA